MQLFLKVAQLASNRCHRILQSGYESTREHIPLVFITSVLCLSGCGPKLEVSGSDSTKLSPASVRVQTAERKPRPVFEEVAGTVRAKRQAILEAKVSGRIDRLPVVLGQRLKSGELVLRLDAAELNARLEQANASLEQSERDWKRVSTLFGQQAVTRGEYDAAQARHRLVQGAAAEAQAMLSYLDLTAPFDGVVAKKWAEVGDLAAPGKPLLSVEDSSALQLETDLPETLSARVQQGARLGIRVDGLTDLLIGSVAEIAPTVDTLSRTLRVKVDLPAHAGLTSGQFARLLVPVGENNRLSVPASAVLERGQLEILFVVAKQRAHLHLIKTGQRVGDEVEVLSGLQADDMVVTVGATQLTDGQPVEAK